ncbi:MAG: xanthine dehydrogenase family protein, partial [Bacteroidetes bacterium]|nr:xanthine dehydrogenase family protein [Bacteroidota bacterium]
MGDLKTPAWRNDAVAKVTGRIKYTDDLKFANLLHAVPVYGDHVHATIQSIDTQAAEQCEGVVRVLTARDVPGSNRHGQIVRDFRVFADDKIRYQGDVVALVVAESREHAQRAAELVRVHAVPLPSILDPEEAMNSTTHLVHEEFGTNIINTHRVRRGNVEEALRASDIILEHRFETPWVEHAYMEPEAAVCQARPDGVVEVYGSMQHPFSTRRFVAGVLGVPLADVEVIGTPMGGGFGGKDDTAAIVCARTALAARLTGRPVKSMYRRDWSIRESYKRHPYRITYTMGVNRDGKIQAVRCRIVADGGAYCSVTPWVTWRSTVQCCGPYDVPHVHCDTFGVYTNNPVTGAMRGFGSPQMNFVVESMIEIAAVRLGMPAIQLRRLNMVKQGSVTITGQKLDNHTVAMEQVLDAVLRESDYEKKLERCAHGGGDDAEQYGIGLAMSYRGVSLGAEGVDFCAAMINVQADGSIVIETGVHENGQGAESAMILIAARELGVPVDRIRYRRSSTLVIPDSGTTVASRGTIMGGGAITLAARDLKERMAQVAASVLNAQPADLEFRDAHLVHSRDGRSMAFDAVVQEMFSRKQFPHAFGVFQAPTVSWDEEHGQGKAYFTWVYGCQTIELTVNRHTGKVRLLNAVAAHDVGKAVNKAMLEGQFYGGMAMGIGYALFEDLEVADGRIQNTNLNAYRIP